jgi:membrane-anchored glycerophosphoryl diester phosphodiesterase (GDPDase)
MKILMRFLFKETFGCFLHHWFITIVCTGVNLFSGVTIMLAGLTIYPQAAKFIQHMRTEHPLMAFLNEKIGNGPLGSTQLIVTAILTYLVSFWVVNVFLLRTNNTIYNQTITLKKLLLTALKLTPRLLLFSFVQFLPVVVLGGCSYILYSKFIPLTVINCSIMAFLVVISLAAVPILLIRLALVETVIINQQCSGFAALRQSWQLTRRSMVPCFSWNIFPYFSDI